MTTGDQLIQRMRDQERSLRERALPYDLEAANVTRAWRYVNGDPTEVEPLCRRDENWHVIPPEEAPHP